MSAMARFDVTWSIDPQQWEIARSHLSDPMYIRGDLAAFHLLYGRVQMAYGEQRLFPIELLQASAERRHLDSIRRGLRTRSLAEPVILEGVGVSLIDFAKFAAHRLSDWLAGNTSEPAITFWASDDPLRFFFSRTGSTIVLSSNAFGRDVAPPKLFVPSVAFVAGVERFLNAFAVEVDQQAPRMLEWEVLDRVRLHRPRQALE